MAVVAGRSYRRRDRWGRLVAGFGLCAGSFQQCRPRNQCRGLDTYRYG